MYRSDDFGRSWKLASRGLIRPWIFSIAAEAGVIYAGTAQPVMGRNGVFVSTDNGENWTLRKGFAESDIRSLLFKDGRLYAATNYDAVFSSDDHGLSWSKAGYGLNDSTVYAICAHGQDILAATQKSGVGILSIPGGPWKETSFGMSVTYIRALAVWGHNILAASYGGGVYLSTNSGGFWKELNTGLTELRVRSLAVVTGPTPWLCAGTDSSGVFRYSLAGITGVNDAPEQLPGNISILQHYPNPCSTNSSVSYSVSGTGAVRISISTILGAEVATEVIPDQAPGKYEWRWNAARQPNGVYLCRIQQGPNSTMRQMLLLK
jgi:hypothetical protein